MFKRFLARQATRLVTPHDTAKANEYAAIVRAEACGEMSREQAQTLKSEGGFTALQVILGLAIGAFAISIIAPMVINQFVGTDTSGWTGSFAFLADFWPIFGLVVIGVFIAVLLNQTGGASRSGGSRRRR